MKVVYGRSEYACDHVMMLSASVTCGSNSAVESADSHVTPRHRWGQKQGFQLSVSFFLTLLGQLAVCLSK